MSFGKLKSRLKALINRKDVTDDLAGDFVTEAVSDLERKLRIGPMESLANRDGWDGTDNALMIPAGYLEMINFFTDAGELTQVDLEEFLRYTARTGPPRIFVKMADRFLVKPTPTPGTNLFLHYYRNSDPLTLDTDVNVWTGPGFNAVVYQAASLAADFYQMEDAHAGRFLARAEQYRNDIAEQDLDEKWSGRIAIPLPRDMGDF